MNIESDKSIYGIIGNPLKHSLSPVMHNAAFEELGVDATYEVFPLKDSELDNFFTMLKDKSSPIFGLNVTVPYKEKVIKYIDTLAPLAEKLNAVNTIVVNKDRKLLGYNTDAPGFLAHMTELNCDLADKRIALLGAGGSARAIIGTLCMIPERPHSIKVYNRTSSKLEALVDDMAQRVETSIIEIVNSIDDLNIELCDILINATSVGLNEDDICIVDADMLQSNLFVYDLIYNPSKTKLLVQAEKKGAKVSNGLGMLYYQGVLALQHWADTQLDNEVKKTMRISLEKAVRNV